MRSANRVVLIHGDGPAEAWEAFARYVSELLGAEMVLRQRPRGADRGRGAWWRETVEAGDLLVVERRERSTVERFLGGAPETRRLVEAGVPVLLAREPRWPFDRLLLVLRDTPTDEPAIRWTLHLSAAGATEVTILPVVPSLPALYAQGSRGQPDLEVLLEPSTPTGRKIDQVVRALLKVGVPEVAVHQQRGAPVWQICKEMAVSDYDLLVIGAESGSRLYRWFTGELLPPLLRRCPIPVLVAERVERSMRVEMADG
jgi:nucleotide-binding universal stress UspA family protein